MLSEALGDDVDVTLIDKNDAFVFGFSKLDVMFGRTTPRRGRGCPTRDFAKPGVRFLQETVTAIDPEARRVTTDAASTRPTSSSSRSAPTTTSTPRPGLAEGGNEFYSRRGRRAARGDACPTFTKGHAIIGVCGAPFKCPPAPSECALLLHDDLVGARRARATARSPFVMPLRHARSRRHPRPRRRSSTAFAERDIEFVPGRRVSSLDPARSVAVLDDGSEMPFDLFLGVPKHRAPDVVARERHGARTATSRSTRATLETRFPGVYAVGDVATVGVPKAGVFAEGAARVVAASLIAALARRRGSPSAYDGRGSCYIEFGARPRRPRRRRLLLGPEADGHLQRAVGRARRREGALRLEPPRPLVRPLTLARRPHDSPASQDHHRRRRQSRSRRAPASLIWAHGRGSH